MFWQHVKQSVTQEYGTTLTDKVRITHIRVHWRLWQLVKQSVTLEPGVLLYLLDLQVRKRTEGASL
jgi:hypothetical protein